MMHVCDDHPDTDGSGEPTEGDPDDPPSTGFLPMSLALGLLVTGLFVLDIVPGMSCGSKASPDNTVKSSTPQTK